MIVKTIDLKTRTVEDLSDTLSVFFYLHPTQRPLHAIHIYRILCGTHRQFATDETRASVVAFSFLVRLVDRLTQRFLLCHFRRGTRSRTLPLARCAIAALQHRALTSLWPSSSQPVVLEGPVGRSIQQHRHGRANHPVSRTTPWQGREAGNAGASPHTFLAALLPKGHLPRS